jgi:hypothetical protein
MLSTKKQTKTKISKNQKTKKNEDSENSENSENNEIEIDTKIKKLVAAFDIGIANMSLCIMELENDKAKILKWNIINIVSDNNKCCKRLKNGTRCNKIAHFREGNNIEKNYCSSHKTAKCKKIKHKEEDNLYELGCNLYDILDKDYKELLENCDRILIENQPVLKNPTIKSIQMILFSYFIRKNKNILNTNPTNKLRLNEKKTNSVLKEAKNKYKAKKELSIEYAKKILKKTDIDVSILRYFYNSKKKDDLADSLLYCYFELFGKNCLCENNNL